MISGIIGYADGIDQDSSMESPVQQDSINAAPGNPVQQGNAGAAAGKTGIRIPKMAMIGVVIVIVAIIAAIGVIMLYKPGPASTTTTTSVTTIKGSNSTTTVTLTHYQINSCTTIDAPGVYNVTSDITASSEAGPCISILADDVVLQGSGSKITGIGPFTERQSPSYGIYVSSKSGVSINGVSVSKFSYGIYFYNVTNSQISNTKTLNSTISGVYLNESSHDTVNNATVYSAESSSGGLFMYSGGNNTVTNSSIMYNAYYGLYLNSSGNRFYSDTFADNPADLMCGSTANDRNTNIFGRSSCQVNDYCNFAACKTSNIPYNINNTSLQNTVTGCGAIDNPGVFRIFGNISLNSYVNSSNPLSSKSTCITINSPDVKLDCMNSTISNAYYGVVVAGLYNTSVDNCAFRNDTYGLYEKGTIGTVLNNIKPSEDTYGVYLENTTGSIISNVTGTGDVFGVYMNAATGTSLYGIKMHGNTYGIYVNGQQGNEYYSGTLANNSKGDLYCSATAYNSTQNIYHPLECGSTDCGWAGSCTTVLPVPLPVTPLYSCGAITSPGNYELKTGLLSGSQTCIDVKADNVTLECNGNIVEGSGSGSGFFVQHESNVSFLGCKVTNFKYAFNVTDSRYVKISNATANKVDYGVYMFNNSYSTVSMANISVFNKGAFVFYGLNNSIIENNSASQSNINAVPFSFSNAFTDIISGNKGYENGGYAFKFTGSKNNSIMNNSEKGSGSVGYYCDAYSSGLYSQRNGVNYGVGKSGCMWMIELNPESVQSCSAILSSSTVDLTQDMLYTYGGTCFSVINQNNQSANNTLINCNGHTVMATKGGTFLNISGAYGTELENCYLKNFTTDVRSNGQDTVIINNTMANSKTAVSISNSKYGSIRNNFITNSSYGVSLENDGYGNVDNNTITKTNISMEFSGIFGENIDGNMANFGNIGVYLLNSTENFFENNILLNQTNSGLICNGGSGNSSTLNKDYGGNVCSDNIACSWMTSSPLCRST